MFDVIFEEGSFTTTIEVEIIDDSLGEEEEIFYGSLTPASAANVLITQDTAEVHIIDNDGMHCL